ncbi:MAG: peptidylprolyl isomerase [Planctomycetes bacterium]|nr:peptidylprolyl isomerase [Planctomycetota bacterium]
MALYVNGEKIASVLIENEIQRLRPSYEQVFQDQPPEQRQKQLAEWARENVIEAVIFRQEASKAFPEIGEGAIQQAMGQLLETEGQTGPIRQQLEAGPDEEAKLHSEIAGQIRRERFIQQIAADIPELKDKAIQRYYEQNIERFTIPETVHAAHIVKHPAAKITPEQLKEQIDGVYQQIDGGAAFEELAAQHSDCPDQGGDLGFFARGKMVPRFEEVAFVLKPGMYSEPFETEFGWHILKVYEKRPAVPCPIEQVREVITRDLKQQAREKIIETFIDAQKAQAVIEER